MTDRSSDRSLALDADYTARLRKVFCQRDAPAFVALSEEVMAIRPGDRGPVERYALMKQLVEHLFLLASAQPAEVDGLVKFLAEACESSGRLNTGETDWGDARFSRCKYVPHATPQFQIRSTQSFADLVFEHITQTFYMLSSCMIGTPTEEFYSLESRRDFFREYYGPCFLLFRAFALLPKLRKRLWREVEGILIATCLSSPCLDPAEWLMLALLLDGAGRSMRCFMEAEGIKGIGKNMGPWSHVPEFPLERWTFIEAMQGFFKTSEGIQHFPYMEEAMTDDLLFLRERVRTFAKQTTSGDAPTDLVELSSAELQAKYGRILAGVSEEERI